MNNQTHLFPTRPDLLVRLILAITLLSFSLLARAEVVVNDCPKIDVADIDKEPEAIAFEPQHRKTVLAFLENLNFFHFNKRAIDDTLSSQFLDKYLERLDPNKAFFLASDIEQFEKQYRTNMDDFLKQIDLKPLEQIYKVYRQRALSQLNANIAMLESEQAYSFKEDDEFYIDRDEYSWNQTQELKIAFWDKRIKLELLNLKLSGEGMDSAKSKLIRRYKTQLNYLKREKPMQMLESYLNAYAALYDPHTNYFSPSDSENFEINISLSLEGIGAVLQQQDEYTKVVRIVPGGPADKNGNIKPEDRITGVAEGENCEMIDVVGWRLDEVVKLIRGTKGSLVKLNVIPAEVENLSEKRKIVTIQRDKVKLEDNAAKSEVIEYPSKDGNIIRIGVIDLPSFYTDTAAQQRGEKNYKSTTRDIRELIIEMRKDKGIDGLVIDLRQNGGGSLPEVVSLTDLFINPGPVVQIKNSRYRHVGSQRARNNQIFDEPLVVLIDRLSASASEIFAAAIQDYGRGLIIGSQTFGKGTVQSIRPLPLGQAKITESKFYRVSGESTQLNGVYPDIQLPQLFDDEDIGESALDYALAWDTIRPVIHKKSNLTPVIKQLTGQHKQRLESNVDLIYLQNQISLDKDRRNKKTISLNENKRVIERKIWESKKLAIENQWRKAKGLPPKTKDQDDKKEAKVAKSDSVEKEVIRLVNNEKFDNSDETEEPKVDEEPDALLIEAGQILVDWLQMQSLKTAAR